MGGWGLSREAREQPSAFLIPARENHYRTKTNVGNPGMSWVTLGVLNPINYPQNNHELRTLDSLQNPTMRWSGMGWKLGKAF